MFNKCMLCGGELSKNKKGSAYGYWGNNKIRFDNIKVYYCDSCEETYLSKDESILTQEITIGLINSDKLKYNEELFVDLNDIYTELLFIVDDVAELIENKKLQFVQIDNKIILNKKDIISINADLDDMLLAARSEENDIPKEVLEIIKNKVKKNSCDE